MLLCVLSPSSANVSAGATAQTYKFVVRNSDEQFCISYDCVKVNATNLAEIQVFSVHNQFAE